MKLIGFSILGIILGLLVMGCATISPSDATKMSSKELCEVLMGVGVPPKDRRVVNAEVVDRGFRVEMKPRKRIITSKGERIEGPGVIDFFHFRLSTHKSHGSLYHPIKSNRTNHISYSALSPFSVKSIFDTSIRLQVVRKSV